MEFARVWSLGSSYRLSGALESVGENKIPIHNGRDWSHHFLLSQLDRAWNSGTSQYVLR